MELYISVVTANGEMTHRKVRIYAPTATIGDVISKANIDSDYKSISLNGQRAPLETPVRDQQHITVSMRLSF